VKLAEDLRRLVVLGWWKQREEEGNRLARVTSIKTKIAEIPPRLTSAMGVRSRDFQA